MDSEFGDGSTSTMTWGHAIFLVGKDEKSKKTSPLRWYFIAKFGSGRLQRLKFFAKQTEIFLGLGGCQMSNETRVTGCYSLYIRYIILYV